ncbi:Inward rectifier potassium channel Kirbac3.1 [Neolewinella maritima]|uniref:Inward rectifier potassium channel Kirbac3.1 n=1 Tax=Neolewinella maritima TaxID=1383882 RepID=A0ABN8FAU9_9BACT|nr:ion channel [Neolewinella maritima]CAH1001661.1 Inward rectifier potassium channel Kirbac3.1 [Neolewinella maritima]
MNLADFRNHLSPSDAAGDPAQEGDFGLGDKVARQPGTRLINSDGSFNVVRRGQSFFAPYKKLVEMDWPRFIIVTLLTYLLCNLAFAVGFYLIGPEELSGIEGWTPFDQFLGCFYFSVQTFTTVGYGTIAPSSVSANALAALLALFGWVALALVTGLFFARFSRPTRMIVFSDKAIVAPFRDGKHSLQFRIANKRDTSLINVQARVVMTWLEKTDAGLSRRFHPLQLERDFVALFPLNWTIVHPIGEDSPLHGWKREDYGSRYSEVLVSLDGYDQTFAQQVHLNNSYTYEEMEWNVRFEPMYQERERTTELLLDRISDTVPCEEE